MDSWMQGPLTQRVSDDPAIAGSNELEYRSVIMTFVDWCGLNHLCLNTSKTEEMLIDYQRRRLTSRTGGYPLFGH